MASLSIMNVIDGRRATLRMYRFRRARATETWAALAVCFAACAPARSSWTEASKPEVYVDVLPKRAALELDGKVIEPGPQPIELSATGKRRLRISAPFYAPMVA